MQKISYSSKYLKIYTWQIISLILNFLSMFTVVLYLTKDLSTYGIYTVCISISIFLAYSDLGFVGAGQKYAAEHFSRGETEEEIKVIGFTSFVLMLFILLCACVFLYLGYHPQLLLKNLDTPQKIDTASKLLIILACFSPLTILQRTIQLIFSIRLEDYITQRWFCIANGIKIISILYFFGHERYLIVQYFLFCQIVTTIAYIIFLFIAYHRYNYNFRLLIASFRFNKTTYKKVYKLALSSFYTTLAWILYYELDSIIIGKFLGVNKVALYAIGLTMLSFFRNILSIIFSPFSVRFNHFVGHLDIEGLKTFTIQVITLSVPIVTLPIIAQIIVTKSFVLSWVGVNYTNSVILAQILISCNIFAFISYPTGLLLIAQEKIKQMYVINTLLPVIYWVGILSLYKFLGLSSFAIFTFIVFSISAAYYTSFLLGFLKISFLKFANIILKPSVIPILFLVVILLGLNNFLPTEKSKINLMIVIAATAFCVLISFVIQYLTSADIQRIAKKVLYTVSKTD